MLLCSPIPLPSWGQCRHDSTNCISETAGATTYLFFDTPTGDLRYTRNMASWKRSHPRMRMVDGFSSSSTMTLLLTGNARRKSRLQTKAPARTIDPDFGRKRGARCGIHSFCALLLVRVASFCCSTSRIVASASPPTKYCMQRPVRQQQRLSARSMSSSIVGGNLQALVRRQKELLVIE